MCNALLYNNSFPKQFLSVNKQQVKEFGEHCADAQGGAVWKLFQNVGQVGAGQYLYVRNGGGRPQRLLFLINRFIIRTSCFTAAVNTLCNFPL